jgi:hypothetical protein
MITRYSELHLKDAEASDDSGEWIIVGVKLEDFERKFVMLRANENGRSGELDVANLEACGASTGWSRRLIRTQGEAPRFAICTVQK